MTQDKLESDNDSEQNVIGLVTCHVLSAVDEADSWIIDSGATRHICNNRQSFLEFYSLERSQHVTLGDGHSLNSIRIGNVAIELLLGNGKTRLPLVQCTLCTKVIIQFVECIKGN